MTYPLPEGQRAWVLDQALEQWVRYGARVEYKSTTWATVSTGEPINHVLHLLVTLVLCGLWAPIWLIITATHKQQRMTLSVDEWGRLQNDHGVLPRTQ